MQQSTGEHLTWQRPTLHKNKRKGEKVYDIELAPVMSRPAHKIRRIPEIEESNDNEQTTIYPETTGMHKHRLTFRETKYTAVWHAPGNHSMDVIRKDSSSGTRKIHGPPEARNFPAVRKVKKRGRFDEGDIILNTLARRITNS